MTCVVGLIDTDHKRVFIGADTAAANADGEIMNRLDEKVFFSGRYLIGFSGSFRAGQLLQHVIELPPPPCKGSSSSSPSSTRRDIHRFMVNQFVEAVRAGYRKAGFVSTYEGGQERGNFFLVAFDDNLFEVEADFQVGIPALTYHAIGAGKDLALGSLHTTRYMEHGGEPLNPRSRVDFALRAAEESRGDVRGPFTILVT